MTEENEQDTGIQLGRGMLIIFWVVVLAMATWLIQDWIEQRDNPNQDVQGQVNADGLREVVLLRNPSGHYVSSGKINGVDVTYLLDTGATGISIPEHIADHIGLKRGVRFTVSTANGDADAYSTKLDSVELGNIALYDLHGSINPNVEYDEILLGMRFLKHLEFTQRGRTLILRQ